MVSIMGLCADLVLVNGKVVTVDPEGSIVEAVAVKIARILAIGSTSEVMEPEEIKNVKVLTTIVDSVIVYNR